MAAGAFHEPLDLQRRSLDPPQDRGCRARCRHRGGGSRDHRAYEFRRRPDPDRSRHEGGQADRYHQLERFPRSLRRFEFQEFTRLFISPPKSPRGYVDDPNPKSTTESARPPRALSHVWGGSPFERTRIQLRHCEELLRRSNPEPLRRDILDCFATLAMT